MTAFVIAERGKNRDVNMHDASLSCSSQTKSHEKKKKPQHLHTIIIQSVAYHAHSRLVITVCVTLLSSGSFSEYSPDGSPAVCLDCSLLLHAVKTPATLLRLSLSLSLSLSLFLNLPPKQPPPPSPFYPNPLPLCPLSVVMATRL